MSEDENINAISEGENDKVLNTLDYITEDGFFITKQLNSSKDKLILKINFSEAKKYYYLKEYTYKELIKACPLFTLEDNIEGIDHIVTESIKNYGAKVCRDKTNENIMNLIIKIKINSKLKEFKLQLDKTDLSKEEFLSSLVDKINNLIEERKQAYGVKHFKDVKKELELKKRNFGDKLENLERKLDKISNTFNIIKDMSLLVNSNIISDMKEVKLIEDNIKRIEKRILESTPENELDQPKDEIFLFKLVYRATRDGDASKIFHKKCDKIGTNLTLIKTDKNVKFGGFTYCNWKVPDEVDKEMKEKGVEKEDKDSFCFSLSLNKIYSPNNEEKMGAIFCSNGYGPTFSENIFSVYDNMLSKGGYCTKMETSRYSGQKEDYEISGGEQNFNIKELEVFELIFI
jgi:hypothetical protein